MERRVVVGVGDYDVGARVAGWDLTRTGGPRAKVYVWHGGTVYLWKESEMDGKSNVTS